MAATVVVVIMLPTWCWLPQLDQLTHTHTYIHTINPQVMLDNLSYFHEDIRRVVVSALKHLLVAAFKVLPPKQTSSGLPEISPDLASALDTITFQLIQRAVCDHDKEVQYKRSAPLLSL